MKRIILSLGTLLAGVFAVCAQEAASNPNAPEITFESEVIDYGTIEHKADGKREFKFKNTGKEPLIITNCAGSCGCTVPTWPKEPIRPGQSAIIGVQYATDRIGAFEKTVTVTSNAKSSSKVLKIKGVVKAPAETAPAVAPSNTKTP